MSQERITTELNKILLAPTPSYGFKLLFQSGLLQLIFPKMAELYGVEKVGKHAHKDNFYHTLQVLDNVASAGGDLWLRWAAVLHDIAPSPATKRLDPRDPRVGWTFHGHEDKGARWVPQLFADLKLPLGEEMRQGAEARAPAPAPHCAGQGNCDRLGSAAPAFRGRRRH